MPSTTPISAESLPKNRFDISDIKRLAHRLGDSFKLSRLERAFIAVKIGRKPSLEYLVSAVQYICSFTSFEIGGRQYVDKEFSLTDEMADFDDELPGNDDLFSFDGYTHYSGMRSP